MFQNRYRSNLNPSSPVLKNSYEHLTKNGVENVKKKQKLTLIYIIVSENGHKNHKVVMTDDINEIFQCLHATRK